jgi:hypothetical protein
VDNQPKTNVVRDEKGDHDSHISNMRMNYFFRLLNEHLVSDVRHMVIRTAEIKSGFSRKTQL